MLGLAAKKNSVFKGSSHGKKQASVATSGVSNNLPDIKGVLEINAARLIDSSSQTNPPMSPMQDSKPMTPASEWAARGFDPKVKV